MNYSVVEAGGEGGISGGTFARPDATPPYTMFYINVDDLQESLAKTESLGGKIAMAPVELPGSTPSFAMFTDLDGNRVGLFSGQKDM